MAITGNGEYPNHLGWLNKKRKPLQNTMILHRTCRFGDTDISENTIWKDWFFQEVVIDTPPQATISNKRIKKAIKRSFSHFSWHLQRTNQHKVLILDLPHNGVHP